MTKDMTSGFTRKADLRICDPHVSGTAVSTVLQYGGYVDRRKIFRSQPASGSRLYVFFELYGAGILYGCLQWVCNSRGSDVRSKRRTQTSTVCNEWRMALHRIFNSDDTGGRCSLPAGSCINADTRRNI